MVFVGNNWEGMLRPATSGEIYQGKYDTGKQQLL